MLLIFGVVGSDSIALFCADLIGFDRVGADNLIALRGSELVKREIEI